MGVETPIHPWGLLPPPRRAPRGGFNYWFSEPENARPYRARGTESGVLKEIPRVAFFILWV